MRQNLNFLKGALLDQLLELQEPCPLKNQGCPVVDELRRLKQEVKGLQELSNTDTLTGLFNFRYLLTALEGEMERTRRTGLSTGLIMIDLDNFKQINDTYGHESGNKALQWCSRIWRENIRRIDIPCRYGGEEFAIILPGARLPQAVRTAERLRALLVNSPVNLDSELARLTASFGVDAYTVRESLSVEAFVKRTDHFLLEAKAKGRNCVCYKEIKRTVAPTEITDKEREALFITRRSARQARQG